SDFCARAARQGWKFYYVAGAECWHRQRAGTEREPYRYHYYIQRNCMIFAHRHFDDAALARVIELMGKKVKKARRDRLLRLIIGEAADGRALRDVWSWVEENRRLLSDERARFADLGRPFNQLALELKG